MRNGKLRTETEATIPLKLTNIDNRRLEKRCLVWWVSISVATFRCRVRIWRKDHESMDPSCIISTIQAGCGGVWCGGYFLGTLGPLSTNWASFKRHSLPEYCCWPCPSLYDYSVSIFWCYFQQDNAPCHKAQIISDWFLEHDNEFTLLKWPPQSPDLNPIEQLWDVVEREIHIMDEQPTNRVATAWCYHVNMDQNIWGMFPTRWIYATKN